MHGSYNQCIEYFDPSEQALVVGLISTLGLSRTYLEGEYYVVMSLLLIEMYFCASFLLGDLTFHIGLLSEVFGFDLYVIFRGQSFQLKIQVRDSSSIMIIRVIKAE